MSMMEIAENLQCPFYQQGRDFEYQETHDTWCFKNQNSVYRNLPKNTLALQNMATVLQTVTLLQNRLLVKREAIDQGLRNVNLPFRIQIIQGQVTEIYDVSHNPAAVKFLSDRLDECKGKTFAVFSMLQDKDIVGSIQNIQEKVDVWYVAPLQTKRAASREL